MEEGQEDTWLHFIRQTLVDPNGEPRNFMEATVNERPLSHREEGSVCSYHQWPVPSTPSLHRLWDHKPTRQVWVPTGGGIVTQRHQPLGSHSSP